MRQQGTCDGKMSDRQASRALALTMMERTFNNLKSSFLVALGASKYHCHC
jgi:hypothetical protein